MLKKMSLFFTAPVRKRIESDSDFCRSRGFLAAIDFPHAALKMFLTIPPFGSHSLDFGNHNPALREVFTTGYAGNKRIREAFEGAARVEATISFVTDLSLEVNMRFFKRGEKTAFFIQHVCFEISNGNVGALGSGQPGAAGP